MAEFVSWTPGPNPSAAFQVQHKFSRGLLDLTVPSWTYPEMVRLVEESPADAALFGGWHAARADANVYR
ncbi:MAG: hypothetical protein ACYCTI_00300 [Acidimicrobiales bacterium]